MEGKQGRKGDTGPPGPRGDAGDRGPRGRVGTYNILYIHMHKIACRADLFVQNNRH